MSPERVMAISIAILLFMFIAWVPKIYLSSKIYSLSKDINVLYSRYYLLKEENRVLNHKLELSRYKQSISTK